MDTNVDDITDIRFDTEKFKASVMLSHPIRLNATQTYRDKYYQNSVVCPLSRCHEYMFDLLVRRVLQLEINLWIGSSLTLGLRIRAQLILCALSLVVLQQSNNNY